MDHRTDPPKDKAHRPVRLLDLTEEDLLPWRGLEVSRLLVVYLRQERTRILERIPEMVSRLETSKAQVETGALFMVDAILAGLHPPPTPIEEPDEPFTDPADISPPRGYRSQTK